MAELAQAVTLQEVGRLTKIPGIGKKTAERLLLELKDKLGADVTTAVGVHRPAPVASDVLNALISLGYSDKEAAHAVKELPDGVAVADGINNFADLQALQILGCDFGQGALLSPAMTKERFIELLQRRLNKGHPPQQASSTEPSATRLSA